YSTASARSVVLKPFWWPPWHKSVWGWGYAVFELICATKPTAPNPGRSHAMAVTGTAIGRPGCVKRLSQGHP
ncbi:hypothetical protein, partial [Paracidovorax anthurii]|uniref:hypothetical protein n=1 Tax=Paracidovorax anthurii TaxID=78229 RepID=UPI0039F08061